MAHTNVIGLQDDGDVDVDVVDVFSESEQAVKQSTIRKPAQPHKLKIYPNFEIWTNFINLDNFITILIILYLSMVKHSTDILVEPPCVTYENVQGQKPNKKTLVLFQIHRIHQSQPCLKVMVKF